MNGKVPNVPFEWFVSLSSFLCHFACAQMTDNKFQFNRFDENFNETFDFLIFKLNLHFEFNWRIFRYIFQYDPFLLHFLSIFWLPQHHPLMSATFYGKLQVENIKVLCCVCEKVQFSKIILWISAHPMTRMWS